MCNNVLDTKKNCGSKINNKNKANIFFDGIKTNICNN